MVRGGGCYTPVTPPSKPRSRGTSKNPVLPNGKYRRTIAESTYQILPNTTSSAPLLVNVCFQSICMFTNVLFDYLWQYSSKFVARAIRSKLAFVSFGSIYFPKSLKAHYELPVFPRKHVRFDVFFGLVTISRYGCDIHINQATAGSLLTVLCKPAGIIS